MRIIFPSLIIVFLYIFCPTKLQAVEKGKKTDADTIKTGWNFGAIPAISYSTDVGFQYGAAINFYDYGDGSRFPTYNHSLYFEVSRYTKGSGVYRVYYNSDQLFKGLQFSVDLSYLPERAYDFYGFNGFESVYNKSWEDDKSSGYKTRMFYKYQQNNFRFKVDLQGKIGESNFKWLAGFNLLDFKLSSVNIAKLNQGKSDANKLPTVEEQPGLYEKYQDWGIIDKKEAKGGFIPEIKGGIVYDTRDNLPNPMKGIWTEAVVAFAPEFLGSASGFTKFSLTHRQYFTLIKNDLSFAYRLGWQETIGGNVPFYYEPQIITSVMTGSSTTGLGSSKTLRGALRNRVVGDGVFYGNLELRWKFYRINIFRQNFYCGLNGFLDFGRVTKKFNVENRLTPMNEPMADYFNFGAEKMHATTGAGLRLAMNYNFVLAMDYGIAMNKQDGNSAIYIGLNYIF